MTLASIDSPTTDLQSASFDETKRVVAGLPQVLPQIDPHVRAIYSIPSEYFIGEASRTLSQFQGVAADLLHNLRQTDGNVRALKHDLPLAFAKFEAMSPVAAIVLGRLAGEQIDGSAKMCLNGARRAFEAFDRLSVARDFIGPEALRECQIGVDFLSVGLSMMQTY